MKFKSVFDNFKALSNGTDAFKCLKNICEALIIENNNSIENSALFLIYGFAKNYVLIYEDQEVTPEFASKAKNKLLDYMSELNSAIESKDPDMILSAMNNISRNHLQNSRIF